MGENTKNNIEGLNKLESEYVVAMMREVLKGIHHDKKCPSKAAWDRFQDNMVEAGYQDKNIPYSKIQKEQTIMKETIDKLTEFGEWCDINLKHVTPHDSIGLEPFGDLADLSFMKMSEINGEKSDYTSFVCGMAAGMKMMELPPNEDALNKQNIESWLCKKKSGTIEVIGEYPEGNEIINKSPHITAHNVVFKFPIITGTQPKSKHPFQMNNWTGYRFTEDAHTIITTPRAVVIRLCETITSTSLESTYSIGAEIAEIYAYKFAKKHGIILGEPQQYGKPHYSIHAQEK